MTSLSFLSRDDASVRADTASLRFPAEVTPDLFEKRGIIYCPEVLKAKGLAIFVAVQINSGGPDWDGAAR